MGRVYGNNKITLRSSYIQILFTVFANDVNKQIMFFKNRFFKSYQVVHGLYIISHLRLNMWRICGSNLSLHIAIFIPADLCSRGIIFFSLIILTSARYSDLSRNFAILFTNVNVLLSSWICLAIRWWNTLILKVIKI